MLSIFTHRHYFRGGTVILEDKWWILLMIFQVPEHKALFTQQVKVAQIWSFSSYVTQMCVCVSVWTAKTHWIWYFQFRFETLSYVVLKSDTYPICSNVSLNSQIGIHAAFTSIQLHIRHHFALLRPHKHLGWCFCTNIVRNLSKTLRVWRDFERDVRTRPQVNEAATSVESLKAKFKESEDTNQRMTDRKSVV